MHSQISLHSQIQKINPNTSDTLWMIHKGPPEKAFHTMLHWTMSTSFHHHHYAHQYTQHPHAHHHAVSYALVPSSALLFVLPAACLSGCLAAMTGKRKQQDSGKWWNQGLKTFKIVNFVTQKCKQIQFQNIILSKIMNSFYIIVNFVTENPNKYWSKESFSWAWNPLS